MGVDSFIPSQKLSWFSFPHLLKKQASRFVFITPLFPFWRRWAVYYPPPVQHPDEHQRRFLFVGCSPNNCILQIWVCQMLLQAQCTWFADCPCHAPRSCQLSGSWHGEAWSGSFLFLALNTCACNTWSCKGKGWGRLCSILPLQCPTAVSGLISQSQEGKCVCPSSLHPQVQVTIQPLCWELEITLQKSGHLSPFSALAILHWFTQLQNKTSLSTPQSC